MITIYKDAAANAVFIEDNNGAQFLNLLSATSNGSDDVSVHDNAREIEIITDENYSEFVDENGASYGANATEVCNALNALFQSSGTPSGEVPEITSSLAISMDEGSTLNYELTANFGVGYEWDLSNVSGVTTVEGNVRKLIGGSSLAVGTYNIPVKAVNYNGEDSETLVLTVSTPPFSNTKSVRFFNQDYIGANASLLDSILGRSGNGSGSSDAWTVSFYYKPSTQANGQTIFYFGDNDVTNAGFIEIRQLNSAGQKKLRLRYGSNNNYIQLMTPNGSITAGTWCHVMVTYDGGTTGAASGSVSDYYSRFSIRIDNVVQTTTNTNGNFGYTGGIDPDNFRLGRFASGNAMRDASVDELAIWGSDQSSNASSIYNSGTPFDLSTLGTPPAHWWRMGDGDTYPNLQDSGDTGGCVFVMYNMTSANIQNDVPS